jgi:hypothetical protein
MIPPCRWVAIAIAIGLPAAAADGPAVLELPCGGRLAGRLATATDATATTCPGYVAGSFKVLGT